MPDKALNKININQLETEQHGLSDGLILACIENTILCLDRHGHAPSTSINVTIDDVNKDCMLEWKNEWNEKINRSWDDHEAAEYGATAIAIAARHLYSKSKHVERSQRGTGVDYWLGAQRDDFLFEKEERLEISGILQQSSSNTVHQRMKRKEKQVLASHSSKLKAHICIVEFSTPQLVHKTLKP